MRVSQLMSINVHIATPETTVREAAQLMADKDIGALPVLDGGRLLGIVTDRDIAVRVVAKGLSSGALVNEAMSRDVHFCRPDDDIEHAADGMARKRIRRLPVVDEGGRLLGIVALGDIAREDKPKRTGETLSKISEPGRK